MTEFADLSAAQLALGAAGTLTVSALLFLALQAIKDFVPTLGGRAALSVLYALSGAIAAALVAQTYPDWMDYTTYFAIVVMTISVSIVAKGIYSQLFHVAQAGVPASSEAVATVVDDPQVDDEPRPLTTEELRLVQLLTDDELIEEAQRRGGLPRVDTAPKPQRVRKRDANGRFTTTRTTTPQRKAMAK